MGELGETITTGKHRALVEEADSDRIPLSRDQAEAIKSPLSCDKRLGRLILVGLVKKLGDEEDDFSREEDAAAWRGHDGSGFVHVA